MSATDEAPSPRRRGRPSGQASRQVVDRLLDAADDLMREHDHDALSERVIAAAAGVNERMIHYYFQGKDGLIFAVIARYRDEVSRTLQALADAPADVTDPTRFVIGSLLNAFSVKSWLMRAGAAELTKSSSPIKQMLIRRIGSSDFTSVEVRRFLTRMHDAGQYRLNVDVETVAMAMIAMVAGIYVVPSLIGDGLKLSTEPGQTEWLDYLTDLFDRQLRPHLYAR